MCCRELQLKAEKKYNNDSVQKNLSSYVNHAIVCQTTPFNSFYLKFVNSRVYVRYLISMFQSFISFEMTGICLVYKINKKKLIVT